MTTRTFTVTVVGGNPSNHPYYNVGSSNKYAIDGSTATADVTVYIAEGGTYVFDQSDGTNENHPLRFSTTANGTHSGGSEYTTGVTTTGVPGNPGAKTTIVVANSAPTLYYYCSNHSNMGWTANTPASDTWGVLAWNTGQWGAQNDVTLSVSGLSTSSAVGGNTIDAEINSGWGRGGWGLLNWGQAIGGVDVSVTGVSASVSVGTLASAEGLIETGWGRGGWGNRVWGDTYSALPSGIAITSAVGTPVITTDVVVSVTGVQASLTNDDATATTSVTITPTGLPTTSSIGTATIAGTGDVIATGLSATSSVGTAVVAPRTIADATGVGLTSSIGTVSIAFDSLIAVTGVSATGSVGSITPVSTYSVTGVSSTSSVGSIGMTGDESVNVTGVILTSSVGSVIIIVWNRIDTGTPVTWTKIVTAA